MCREEAATVLTDRVIALHFCGAMVDEMNYFLRIETSAIVLEYHTVSRLPDRDSKLTLRVSSSIPRILH